MFVGVGDTISIVCVGFWGGSGSGVETTTGLGEAVDVAVDEVVDVVVDVDVAVD
jgi:hypothetical protein